MALTQRYLIFFGLLTVFLTAGLRAQEAVPVEQRIELKFTAFAPRAIKGLCYFPDGDKEPAAGMKFYNAYRSPVFSYRGGSVLRFYDQAEVEAAIAAVATMPPQQGNPTPKPVFNPVAVCVIPQGVTKAFLLFMPRRGAAIGGFKYDVFVMDDGETSVPPGHFVIINASKLEMFSRINGVDSTILRGVSEPIKAEKGLVIFMAARTEPEFHKLLISDTWDLGPRQRNLLIFFPPKSDTALLPEVIRLNDEVPEEKKK
jgi:hypothetical protein